jgi:hypothetical protein
MSASISDVVEKVLVRSCSFWLRSVHVVLLNAPSLVIVLGWVFVVGVVDLVGSLKETPCETRQVAAKSFVPAKNAFLFVQGLLDQQLSVT